MNKLLSGVSAIGMLLAVNFAQAAEVLTDENLDIVTAGAVVAAMPASSTWAGAASVRVSPTNAGASASVLGVSPYTATATGTSAAAGHCNGNCTITVTP